MLLHVLCVSVPHCAGPPTIKPSQLLNPYVRQPSKPWALVCLNPFKDEWLRVLDTTPWAGWRPQQQGFAEAAAEELVGFCRRLSGSQSQQQISSGGASEARAASS